MFGLCMMRMALVYSFSIYDYAHKLVTNYKTVKMKNEEEHSEGYIFGVKKSEMVKTKHGD